MSRSSSVIGPPGMRSTLTTLVWPTRAHSVMICRSVASLATIDTWPSCMVTCTSAHAVEAIDNAPTVTSARSFIRRLLTAFILRFWLLLPEVVDHLDQDVVQPVSRRVANELLDLFKRRHAPGHVLEARLIGLVVRDELDDRPRPAQLPHPLGELQDRHFLHIADVDDLADRLGLSDELHQRIHDVGNVRKRAGLGAVA